MTGKEKIEAAFSDSGTLEIPVVLPYENLFARDHWKDITSCPWWYIFELDVEKQAQWQIDLLKAVGHDWYRARPSALLEDQKSISIEVHADGVYKVDKRTSEKIQIHEPEIGTMGVYPEDPENQPDTYEKIDELIAIQKNHNPQIVRTDGRGDLSLKMLNSVGDKLSSIFQIATMLWRCNYLWGYENTLVLMATNPDLVEYACKRYLEQAICEVREAAALGVKAMWLEECLTDIIRPDMFEKFNVPIMSDLIDEIRSLGMKSIYYYTGDPAGKWEHILSVGADALAFEEGKKGFDINIEDVADMVKGKCTILGNIDSIGVLEQGTEEELKAEIVRQIQAGRKNNNKFIMSLGSPVTPATSLERLRLYVEMTHEIGSN